LFNYYCHSLNYKIERDELFSFNFNDVNNYENTTLKREIEKWINFSSVLRKQNREIFKEMLQSAYKYSKAINAKGEQFSTESLIMSLLLEQYKIKLITK
jgi:hypothetical protein